MKAFRNSRYKKLFWTEHAKLKMKQYGLSKYKLIRLIQKPERKEEGIAPGTVAVMWTNVSYSKTRSTGSGRAKRPAGETWLMYADSKDARRIVSAWRYPGISKPGESIPIPQDIKDELLNYELS